MQNEKIKNKKFKQNMTNNLSTQEHKANNQTTQVKYQ